MRELHVAPRVLADDLNGNLGYDYVSIEDLAEALQSDYSYVYHFSPHRPHRFIDISDVSSFKLIVQYATIDDHSIVVPFLEGIAPFVPSGASYFWTSFDFTFLSHGIRVASIAQPYLGADIIFDNGEFSFEFNQGLYGKAVIEFHTLPSGVHVQK